MNPLQQLSNTALAALSRDIASGRVIQPFTPIALRPFCDAAHAEQLAKELQSMCNAGASNSLLVHFLNMLIAEREQLQGADTILDLVLSGPEVPGTTFRDTGAVIQELFAKAKSSVLVAGYAVYQGKKVFRALAERMEANPELTVQMYLDVQRHRNDTTRDSDLLRRFAHKFITKDWPGNVFPDVYYDPRSLSQDPYKRSSLHAKCIVIDAEHIFISSANFTEAAQVRNIEVGVLMHSTHLAAKLIAHFQALTEQSVLKSLNQLRSHPTSPVRSK